MSNLIYRQAAIKVASKECYELRGVFGRIEEGLNELPTVEAIPIEWLKNELIPKAEKLGATEYANNIRFVLEDWEAWKRYRG